MSGPERQGDLPTVTWALVENQGPDPKSLHPSPAHPQLSQAPSDLPPAGHTRQARCNARACLGARSGWLGCFQGQGEGPLSCTAARKRHLLWGRARWAGAQLGAARQPDSPGNPEKMLNVVKVMIMKMRKMCALAKSS